MPLFLNTAAFVLQGFAHCLDMARHHVAAVHDVTVGYPDFVPQNERTLLAGVLPRESARVLLAPPFSDRCVRAVHFHCQRYDISKVRPTVATGLSFPHCAVQIPTDEAQLATWLGDVWREKDVRFAVASTSLF